MSKHEWLPPPPPDRAIVMMDYADGQLTPVPFDELPPIGEPLIPINLFQRQEWFRRYQAHLAEGLHPDLANYQACAEIVEGEAH